MLRTLSSSQQHHYHPQDGFSGWSDQLGIYYQKNDEMGAVMHLES